MRVIRLIEIDGTQEFIEKTLRLSYTHGRSLEMETGCFVTGTILPEEADLPREVREALQTLRAHAQRLADLAGRARG